MVAHNWEENVIFGPVEYLGNINSGDIFTGVTINYDGCKPHPHLLAVISVTPLAPAPYCTMLAVLPDPAAASGEIEVVDCSGNVFLDDYIRWMCVDPPGWCCLVGPGAPCDLPVAAEKTTWGAIKSLYQ